MANTEKCCSTANDVVASTLGKVGINRSLLKNMQLAEQVEASTYFSHYGFFFREAPTITKLRPLLDSWLSNVQKRN